MQIMGWFGVVRAFAEIFGIKKLESLGYRVVLMHRQFLKLILLVHRQFLSMIFNQWLLTHRQFLKLIPRHVYELSFWRSER